jgi:putative restriction endonuclease
MTSSPADRWRNLLSDLHTWKRGSQRAVHKPLLTLMLIARADARLPAEVHFAEIEKELARHLREFGPTRSSYHLEFPFWHLKTDGFWKLKNPSALEIKTGGNSPSRSTLLKADAAASVTPELWEALKRDGRLREELTTRLLTDFWPTSQHLAIRSALALPEAPGDPGDSEPARRRNPRFRTDVLTAYERRCAICGYDGRLADVLLGVDAAHVKWWAYDGPDTVSNGMALCSFHHVAFDAGALGLTDDLRVLVSAQVSGQTGVEEWLHGFVGGSIQRPQAGFAALETAFVRWHRGEVFKGPARGGDAEGSGSGFSLAADGK